MSADKALEFATPPGTLSAVSVSSPVSFDATASDLSCPGPFLGST